MAPPTQPPEPAPTSDLRQGAMGAAAELEMVVWLEGHEPYVQEFCLNADQAMERLGIKRSRLNQISGKELRVGRIKSGRYIKPMYREQDIEGYLQWTRPTASHQASKRALESATAGIDAKLDSLASRLDDQLAQSHHRASQVQHAVAVDVMEWLAPLFTSLRQELAAIKRDLDVGQFERKQLGSAVARQRRSAEERAEQLSRATLDIQHAIAVSQQSLNLAGRLEAQNSLFTSQLQALETALKAHIDHQVASAANKVNRLAEGCEHFATTQFPGVIHASHQASLEALLGHLDLRLKAGPLAAKPRPRQPIKRRYSAGARRRPSLLSHRG